jgi:hypothetical protein
MLNLTNHVINVTRKLRIEYPLDGRRTSLARGDDRFFILREHAGTLLVAVHVVGKLL